MYAVLYMTAAFFFGITLGALANFISYRLLEKKTFPRTKFSHFLPIFGTGLAKKDADSSALKAPLRPMIIELLSGVFIAFFYYFHLIRPEIAAQACGITMTHGEILTLFGRFLFQSVMLTLLLTASLIDLDEKVIPDAITVPGTLFALFMAFLFPLELPFREPVSENQAVVVAEMDEAPRLVPENPTAAVTVLMPEMSVPQGPSVVVQPVTLLPLFPQMCWASAACDRMMLYPISAASPFPPTDVVREPGRSLGLWGILTALACWWLWCFALMRRVWHTSRGWKKALEIFWLRLTRDPMTRFLVMIGNIGTILIMLAWLQKPGDWWTPQQWLCFWSAIVSMTIAGGIMWVVRYVSSIAMQREAMGFGDVTLMAMLGACLGWQPCLILFFIAPVVGLVMALLKLLLYGETEIPYGPFLCGAAVVTILLWQPLWKYTYPLFTLGSALIWLGLALLLAMIVLLALLQWIKKLLNIGQ